MTPQEKAQEILDKLDFTYTHQIGKCEVPISMHNKQKIQCALVFVDLMLDNAGFIWGGREEGVTARDMYKKYWNEVKQILHEKHI